VGESVVTPAKDVLIAGGGVAGLACALALSDIGLRVEVFERDERLGGRASSWTDAHTGDVIDIGPHVVTTEHRNWLAMLRRLGNEGEVCWQPQPLITLFDGGKRLPMHASRLPTPFHALPNLRQALRCVGWRDLLSNARVAWLAARMNEADSMALDAIDALRFLRRHGVTPRFIDWFWASSTLALLNVPLKHCSAGALMRMFRLLMGRSGYHFGFPKLGLSQMVAEPAARAIEAQGGSVRRNAEVRRLLFHDGRFAGFVLADGSEVHAKRAVLALPPDALAQLEMPWLPPAVHRFEPSPYVCTMLWFDRRVTHDRFWARVWSPRDLNTDFYDLANIRGAPADAPSLIASNAIHAHEAFGWTDDRIVSQTRKELADYAPAARDAVLRHAVVHRVPMAIPCPLPGSESLRPDNATPLHGVWLAGDWTRTALPASMESAARSGHLAAERIAADMGRRLAVVQPLPDTTGIAALLRLTLPRPSLGLAALGPPTRGPARDR
jgi:uncharacterized protein with NAD-binding domain and iron-sulfur cluster